MNKINELTPAQELLVSVYREKWLAIGRSTERIDQAKSIQAVKALYRIAGEKEPTNFHFFDSPLACQKAVNVMKNNKTMSYEPMLYPSFWTGWVGFYDFILNILFSDEVGNFKNFIEYMDAIKELHAIIAFEDHVFISDRPVFLALDDQGRQHHETAPSMQYKDGYALYNLHGISVPAWAIETPKHMINPKDVLSLPSTEQRMAIMRHVGLACFMDTLNAELLDKTSEYGLYYITLENVKMGPYLYMKCPSSGREFLEGVGDIDENSAETIDKSIKTCEDALKWRMMKASNNLMTKFLSSNQWKAHA